MIIFTIENYVLRESKSIHEADNFRELMLSKLRDMNNPELTKIFSALPSSLIVLILESAELGTLAPEVLVQIFADLPRSILELSIAQNELGNLTGQQLALILAALPPTLVSIDLADNELNSRTGAELAQAFTSLPQTLLYISLDDNRLGLRPGAELVQIFAALPPTLRNLDLSRNILWRVHPLELAHALATLHTSLTHIVLNMNELGDSRHNALIQIFSCLPQSLTSIDLQDNNLFNKSCEELVMAFLALPKSLITINLRKNSLFIRPSWQLAKMFAALPQSVININLLENGLESRTDSEIVEIFAPFLNSNNPKKIIIDFPTMLRLNNIFNPILATPRFIIAVAPKRTEVTNTSSNNKAGLIFSCICGVDSTKKSHMPYGQSNKQTLPLQMLTQDDNINLNVLTTSIFEQIAQRVIERQCLPIDSRLRSSKSLLEKTRNPKHTHIPELKFLYDTLIRVLDSGIPIPDICAQIIQHQRLMPINLLMYELPAQQLYLMILQLRTHQPIDGLSLIVDLTVHLLVKSHKLIHQETELREQLIGTFEWLKNKSPGTIDVDDIENFIAELKKPKRSIFRRP